jgi:hypothetical protein
MPDEFDAAGGDSLTIAQREALIARLRTAWNNLPPEKQSALKPMIDDAHQQLGAFLQNGRPPDHHARPLLRMKSYLTGDWDQHLKQLGEPINQAVAQPLAEPETAIEISVGPAGEILGTGKYQQLDPRWELVAGTVWLENLLHKHPFPPGAPAIHPVEDNVTIAMAGDFGTGNFGAGDSPSVKISKFIPTLNPDYTIHLGDVYYAGTNSEETANFLRYWPSGSKGCFTLNSNHEMYTGGGPYFNEVVGGPKFNILQSPFSFFALENKDWIIVGLDSAYYSDVMQLYMNGTLGANLSQQEFLKQVAQKGKKVVVLTHHNPLPVNGDLGNNPPQLFTDVMSAFEDASPPAYWYYGHEHVGAVYAPLTNNTRCRCLGHGALPWGVASDLQAGQAAGRVIWFESRNAGDANNHLRVYNGFVYIKFDGPNLTETFYDENGKIAWTG